jgi:hypothetical protein
MSETEQAVKIPLRFWPVISIELIVFFAFFAWASEKGFYDLVVIGAVLYGVSVFWTWAFRKFFFEFSAPLELSSTQIKGPGPRSSLLRVDLETISIDSLDRKKTVFGNRWVEHFLHDYSEIWSNDGKCIRIRQMMYSRGDIARVRSALKI